MRTMKFLMFSYAAICMLMACGNNSNSSGSSEQSYREAVKKLDFDTARDILNSFHEKYLEELSKGEDNVDERKAAEGKYYNAFDYIYKSEIQYLLSELNDDECKDKIMFILDEIPIEGEKFPEGLCDFWIANRGDDGLDGGGIALDAYIVWTQHFNRLCSIILSSAINSKNQELAKLILLKFVDNVEVTNGGDNVKINGVSVDFEHGYIKYTTKDRDVAQKKYDEAVKKGAFE